MKIKTARVRSNSARNAAHDEKTRQDSCNNMQPVAAKNNIAFAGSVRVLQWIYHRCSG
jgi:hypothetical protein